MLMTRHLGDLHATQEVGERLGRALRSGDFVGLVGTLGSGKTTLVRALASGAGVGPNEVSSPTFSLIHRYHGSGPTVHHADLYRLSSRDELYATGYFDLLDGEGVVLVEWIDRIPAAAPRQWLELRLSSTGSESRRLEAVGHGPRGDELLAQL
jgi:tRNA threonylcarbamoyladenosine biosynthesis protein TsaE